MLSIFLFNNVVRLDDYQLNVVSSVGDVNILKVLYIKKSEINLTAKWNDYGHQIQYINYLNLWECEATC